MTGELPAAEPDESNLDERALVALSGLLRVRHAIDDEVAALIGRPPTPGGIGEVVAASIFDIKLAKSGVNAGYDGHFRSGPLAGATVNIKAYSERSGLLDISPHDCDWYLVLVGPPRESAHKGRSLPFRIASVYLFDIAVLREVLKQAGVGIGVASSVRKAIWEANSLYPASTSPNLVISDNQRLLLKHFER